MSKDQPSVEEIIHRMESQREFYAGTLGDTMDTGKTITRNFIRATGSFSALTNILQWIRYEYSEDKNAKDESQK